MVHGKAALVLRPEGIPASLHRRWQDGLAALSAQVLADCNRYARDDTGRLIASSRSASALAQGKLVWQTPYARRVYYTGCPSPVHNPNASLRWCEKAKAAHADEWAQAVGRLLGGE